MNKFVPYYKEAFAVKPSGTTEEDQWNACFNSYYRDTGTSEFRFLSCFKILKQLPKFDPLGEREPPVNMGALSGSQNGTSTGRTVKTSFARQLA